MGKVTTTSELSPEKVAWSDWGIYSYSPFTSQFHTSPEIMRVQTEGPPEILELILEDKEGLGGMGAQHPIAGALMEFARRMIPHRQECLHDAVVYNPYRDNRPGAKSLIPRRGPDVFMPLLEGDMNKGHAIVISYDQDNDSPVDALFAEGASARTLKDADAHAVTVDNRFQSFVRVMDPKLEMLLRKIGFESPAHLKPYLLTSIPFGMNYVSFPLEYHESHSTMPVHTLYSTMISGQRSLKRTFSSLPSLFHEVFFNLEPFAGGTVPRVHMQIYARTRGHPQETYEYPREAQMSSRDFEKKDIASLGVQNRSWFAYLPQVKKGRYSLRIELKQEREKDFSELNDTEMWDLAEMLVCLSNSLDSFLDETGKARNIGFFPKGTIIKPFGLGGGWEAGTNEQIFGKSPAVIARELDDIKPYLDRKTMYRVPADSRGAEEFGRLADETSPIYRMSA